MTRRITGWRIAFAAFIVAVIVAGTVIALNLRGEDALPEPAAPFVANAAQIERGAYLARAGNCVACHTARGGAAYAGGLAIETPFGTVYASNLTPDAKTGIGEWSAGHFWRAMHNGRSKDGRLLYPAFPYPNFTQITREDSDALYAFLRAQPPVDQPNRAHALRFPYDSQAALAAWRALFFSPATFTPESAQSAEWNRGAYLVRGLGHCNACHASRNAFGATRGSLELSGGLIPMQNWYAPSLSSPHEGGVSDWPADDIVALLKTGVAPSASVLGPMAEVVYRSTQYLSDADLRAMGIYLKALPQSTVAPAKAEAPPDPAVMARAGKLYEQHCAACHGDAGQGARGAYPALAGNRAVTMASSANLVRVLVSGGFPPATAGNPRPYGMPPFGQVLNDAQLSDLATYLRASWGNQAPAVSRLEVLRFR